MAIRASHRQEHARGGCIRTYIIDGKRVTVRWVQRQLPTRYTILVEGTPTAGSVEKTRAGAFLATDAQGRPLGTFQGLREAVEHVVRAEQPQD